MKIDILASGSKANCTLLRQNDNIILIDAGLNYRHLKNILDNKELNINNIKGILITHCHHDHILGLSGLLKRINTKVYVPLNMVKEINKYVAKDNIEIVKEEFKLANFNIKLLYTSHDVECSVGYIISYLNKEMVYITDTGYINKKILAELDNKDIYIVESNHDEEILIKGSYPLILKQRIISDVGHLSNNMIAKYMQKKVGSKTKYVILTHLSEKNNTEELAYNTMKKSLDKVKFNSENIIIAKQNEPLETIEV